MVPNQDPNKIGKIVIDFLNKEFAKMDSPNKLNAVLASGGKPWMADPNDPNFVAGRKAVKSGESL